MRITRQVLYFLLAIAAFSAVACNRDAYVEAAREKRQPTVTPAEQEFLMKAADVQIRSPFAEKSSRRPAVAALHGDTHEPRAQRER